MTEAAQTVNLDQLLSTSVTDVKPKTRRLVLRAALLVTLLVVASIVVVLLATRERARQIYGELENRAAVFSGSRAQVIETWLDDFGSAGRRLAQSDLFRLFATELDISGQAVGPDSALAPQLPYMIQAMTDLARQERFVGVYLVDRAGRASLLSAGAPELTQPQRRAAARVFELGQRVVTPARTSADGLSMDVVLPVAPPQDGSGNRPTVTGAILLTVPVTARLAQLLAPSPLFQPGERTRLIQIGDGAAEEIDPARAPFIHPVRTGFAPRGVAPTPFAARRAINGDREVLSTGVPVAGMPWMVFHEIDESGARTPLNAYRWSMIAFAALVTALLVAGFVALWWRQASEHTRALAIQFRELSTQINAQRRLLDSILNNVHEMIGLKTIAGAYSYVNKAFETAIGRSGEQIVGLDDSALFGHGTAERLQLQDQSAIRGGAVVTFNEEIYLGSKLHHFQISKVPFVDGTGTVSGIVSVARDITDIVENERRRQRAVEQMTRALMRTIEGVDPYLAGHAARVQRFCSAVARRLTLPPRDALTVEIAAAVCQVGKTAIPKGIVAKQGRLTPEEFEIMKTHIDHAIAVLSAIDFELPIVDVVARMHERLDGSGYPKGLKGAEIGTLGGILGICDVFCARIEPRSYRHRLQPDEALEILKENAGRYDASLVAALAEVVHSVEGEKLVASAQN